MTQHTPTPWKWYWEENTYGPDCGILSEVTPGHAYSVARCPKYQKQDKWEADAKFIITAVNSHDGLLEALESITGLFEPDPKQNGNYTRKVGQKIYWSAMDAIKAARS